MRGYIFTQHERTMLEKYLVSDEKSYGFDQLRKRIKDNYAELKNDFELLEEVKRKMR